MARFLNRIATRMWLLAGLMAAITIVVTVIAWWAAVDLGLMQSPRQLPPEVREELRILAIEGKSDRYLTLVDQHVKGTFRTADWIYLGSVGLISTIVGGGIGLALARRISRPIAAVAVAASKVSSGEHSVRVDPAGASGEARDLVESFNRMAAELETYERERRVLTAGIAHELRTPLTILGGRLHGLVDGVIIADADEAARLLRQVDQLARLVDDLRTLAHAEAGELGLERRATDPGDTVRAVIADLRPSAEAVGVRIVHELEPVFVCADAGRLYQIVTNLVTNAIKHSPRDGEILITARRLPSEVQLRVIDEGPGLRADHHDRVFLPFWRARESVDAGQSGSGLGLALAASLAEAHGGTLSVANRETGHGAVFQLRLPLDVAAARKRR